MNNAKMWLVVSPNVGVPIFLGAVAVGSFAVHVAVLSNTGWVSDFLSGEELGSGAEEARLLDADAVDTAKVAYVMPGSEAGSDVTVILPDGSTATATLHQVMASADPLRRTE